VTVGVVEVSVVDTRCGCTHRGWLGMVTGNGAVSTGSVLLHV